MVVGWKMLDSARGSKRVQTYSRLVSCKLVVVWRIDDVEEALTARFRGDRRYRVENTRGLERRVNQ